MCFSGQHHPQESNNRGLKTQGRWMITEAFRPGAPAIRGSHFLRFVGKRGFSTRDARPWGREGFHRLYVFAQSKKKERAIRRKGAQAVGRREELLMLLGKQARGRLGGGRADDSRTRRPRPQIGNYDRRGWGSEEEKGNQRGTLSSTRMQGSPFLAYCPKGKIPALAPG